MNKLIIQSENKEVITIIRETLFGTDNPGDEGLLESAFSRIIRKCMNDKVLHIDCNSKTNIVNIKIR